MRGRALFQRCVIGILIMVFLFAVAAPMHAGEKKIVVLDADIKRRDSQINTLLSVATSTTGSNALISKETVTAVVNQLVQQQVEKKSEYEAMKKAAEEYAGFGFGVALGYRQLNRCSQCVGEAQVVNGVVRITEEQREMIGFMLETHYYVRTNDNEDEGYVSGWGPFVAFDPGDAQNSMRSVGIGIMGGWRAEDTKTRSFNFGLGWQVDRKVKVFGDGIEANKPLPAGETEIRYRRISRSGPMAVLSYSF